MKTMFKVTGFVFLGAIMGFVLVGCETFDDFLTGSAYAYGNTNETGLVYTFYNNSSYSVTISDETGSRTIPAGSSAQVRFNSGAPVSNVRYVPDDLVSCEISGTGVFFHDK